MQNYMLCTDRKYVCVRTLCNYLNMFYVQLYIFFFDKFNEVMRLWWIKKNKRLFIFAVMVEFKKKMAIIFCFENFLSPLNFARTC